MHLRHLFMVNESMCCDSIIARKGGGDAWQGLPVVEVVARISRAPVLEHPSETTLGEMRLDIADWLSDRLEAKKRA
jgi:hypothetical protein